MLSRACLRRTRRCGCIVLLPLIVYACTLLMFVEEPLIERLVLAAQVSRHEVTQPATAAVATLTSRRKSQPLHVQAREGSPRAPVESPRVCRSTGAVADPQLRGASLRWRAAGPPPYQLDASAWPLGPLMRLHTRAVLIDVTEWPGTVCVDAMLIKAMWNGGWHVIVHSPANASSALDLHSRLRAANVSVTVRDFTQGSDGRYIVHDDLWYQSLSSTTHGRRTSPRNIMHLFALERGAHFLLDMRGPGHSAAAADGPCVWTLGSNTEEMVVPADTLVDPPWTDAAGDAAANASVAAPVVHTHALRDADEAPALNVEWAINLATDSVLNELLIHGERAELIVRGVTWAAGLPAVSESVHEACGIVGEHALRGLLLRFAARELGHHALSIRHALWSSEGRAGGAAHQLEPACVRLLVDAARAADEMVTLSWHPFDRALSLIFVWQQTGVLHAQAVEEFADWLVDVASIGVWVPALPPAVHAAHVPRALVGSIFNASQQLAEPVCEDMRLAADVHHMRSSVWLAVMRAAATSHERIVGRPLVRSCTGDHVAPYWRRWSVVNNRWRMDWSGYGQAEASDGRSVVVSRLPRPWTPPADWQWPLDIVVFMFTYPGRHGYHRLVANTWGQLVPHLVVFTEHQMDWELPTVQVRGVSLDAEDSIGRESGRDATLAPTALQYLYETYGRHGARFFINFDDDVMPLLAALDRLKAYQTTHDGEYPYMMGSAIGSGSEFWQWRGVYRRIVEEDRKIRRTLPPGGWFPAGVMYGFSTAALRELLSAAETCPIIMPGDMEQGALSYCTHTDQPRRPELWVGSAMPECRYYGPPPEVLSNASSLASWLAVRDTGQPLPPGTAQGILHHVRTHSTLHTLWRLYYLPRLPPGHEPAPVVDVQNPPGRSGLACATAAPQ